ncbi:hypothetical protein [Jatrophihabitans fulvus]
MEAMHAGRLDARYTDRLLEFTAHLSDSEATELERRVLPDVDEQTVPPVRPPDPPRRRRHRPRRRRPTPRMEPRKAARRHKAAQPTPPANCELTCRSRTSPPSESLLQQRAKQFGVDDRRAHLTECRPCAAPPPRRHLHHLPATGAHDMVRR